MRSSHLLPNPRGNPLFQDFELTMRYLVKLAHRISVNAIALTWVLAVTACSGMSARDKSTAVGAGVGAVGGSVLTGGSAVGTIGGAAVGGVIGHEVGK